MCGGDYHDPSPLSNLQVLPALAVLTEGLGYMSWVLLNPLRGMEQGPTLIRLNVPLSSPGREGSGASSPQCGPPMQTAAPEARPQLRKAEASTCARKAMGALQPVGTGPSFWLFSVFSRLCP